MGRGSRVANRHGLGIRAGTDLLAHPGTDKRGVAFDGCRDLHNVMLVKHTVHILMPPAKIGPSLGSVKVSGDTA